MKLQSGFQGVIRARKRHTVGTAAFHIPVSSPFIS